MANATPATTNMLCCGMWMKAHEGERSSTIDMRYEATMHA
jgi:hypothetical protein